MQRSARMSRPGLTGSSRQALVFGRAGGIVLEAVPDTTTSTSLRWTDGELKEDGFKIERSTDGVTFSQITTVGSGVLQYNDTGLTESTEYYYRVREYLGSDDGPYSNVAVTWTVPDTPTSLTATAVSSSQIDLAWTDVSTGNTGYVIERRSPAGSGTYVQVGTAGATATSFSDTLLTASTQYEYRVAASNPAGISAYSSAANATTQSATIPSDPTGVSASPSTDGSAVAVTITWTDASGNEDGFYVYRNTTNTTVGATLLSTLGAGVQTYTDNAANSGANAPAINTTYYYFVSAYNGAGESTKVAASQNATGGVTTLNVPAAPTSLTATATSTTQIDLAWTDNATNETGYTVERRSPAGSGSYSTVTTLSAGANSFSNTGLTESVQYEYRVYATNAAGNSANSNAADKYTIPATPTGLTATAISSSQIDLAWTDVSTGNTGQRIERRSPSGSGSYSTLTTVSATATTYSDTGLAASTSYEYRIVATNPDYDSSPSTAASATTQSGSSTYSVSFLVIAGGGGGGGNISVSSAGGAGGGAGGYRCSVTGENSGGGASAESPLTVSVGTSYTVTVGAGGAGAASGSNALGTQGSNSVFGTITSTGGGGGRTRTAGTGTGGNGGSGGGGNLSAGANGGTGTTGEGYAGGNSVNTGAGGGPAGGGGAGAAGTNTTGVLDLGYAGGNGVASSITGSSVTRAGGGGSGGRVSPGVAGTGGSGGGAAGGKGNQNGFAGTVNTGGGGGGAGGVSGSNTNGGSGGSGVVILRMATANYSGTTTGSPTVTTSGSDTILEFTASGSYTA